jgi:hypothetical protein
MPDPDQLSDVSVSAIPNPANSDSYHEPPVNKSLAFNPTLGFNDTDQPQGAVLPRRRSSVSTHDRALLRRKLLPPKSSTAASTPTIPQGIPVDGETAAAASSLSNIPAFAVQPRRAKPLDTQVANHLPNSSNIMLAGPVSPEPVGRLGALSSGSEAASELSGYRSDGLLANSTAYSTAPTSVNNTPGGAILSSKFPPKSQQLPTPNTTGLVPSTTMYTSEPYVVGHSGASRLAQAAAANMAKRGMMMGKGVNDETEDGEEHPLSEKVLTRRYVGISDH